MRGTEEKGRGIKFFIDVFSNWNALEVVLRRRLVKVRHKGKTFELKLMIWKVDGI